MSEPKQTDKTESGLKDFQGAFSNITRDILTDTKSDAVMVVAVKDGDLVVCPGIASFEGMATLLEMIPTINKQLEGMARSMLAETSGEQVH